MSIISVKTLNSLVCVCVSLMVLLCVYACVSVTVRSSMCWCARLWQHLSFVACLHLCVSSTCVRSGQGSRHAAVCRPAVPGNGGTADDTTTADGGGPEVAGAGGEASGNTQCTLTDTADTT